MTSVQWLKDILNILPESINGCIKQFDATLKNNLNEIRITANKPVIADFGAKCTYISLLGTNGCTLNVSNSVRGSKKMISDILNMISDNSLYAYDSQLKNGFITLKGGHRIGVAGTAVYDNGEIKTIKNISSVSVRIAKNIDITDAEFIKNITEAGGTVKNTLIAGKPKSGKTTLVRSAARYFSDLSLNGGNNKILKVGIIDERMEIASVCNGESMLNTGINSFVINGTDKLDGVEIMVRAFAPDIIVMDEIWSLRDIEAVKKAIGSGCKVICTAHGSKNDIDRLFERLPVEMIIYIEKTNLVQKYYYER